MGFSQERLTQEILHWRNDITMMLDALDRIRSRQRRRTALSFDTLIIDQSFVGDNAEITKAELVAAMDSATAVVTQFDNNATAPPNLNRVRK